MKTKLLILIALAAMNVCFGQEAAPEKSYDDYMKDGRANLIVGLIFTAGSAAVLVTLANGNVDLDNAPIMLAGGVILLGAGIVLLSSSGKNFERARKVSISADFEKLDLIRQTSKVSAGVPGISLKWNF